ncbi:MAG: GDP-mannose 4,6-dehydratase, partial [Solirubrobacteraceae bacterium]
SSGILFNHESPRRPPEFVTRKITRTAAAIKLGLESELRLGDLEATRDWSYAGDVAEAMWLMLQQDEGGDYVVCSGVSRTVRALVETAFAFVDVDPEPHVIVAPEFVRAPDPVALVGDPSKARTQLGWQPRTSFEELIGMMVTADLHELSAP